MKTPPPLSKASEVLAWLEVNAVYYKGFEEMYENSPFRSDITLNSFVGYAKYYGFKLHPYRKRKLDLNLISQLINDNLSFLEAYDAYYTITNTYKMSFHWFYQAVRENGLYVGNPWTKLNDEHMSFLKEHEGETLSEIYNLFQDKFKLDISKNAIRHILDRNNINYERKCTFINEEEDKWIVSNVSNFKSNKHAAKMFEEYFGRKVSENVIRKSLKRNNLTIEHPSIIGKVYKKGENARRVYIGDNKYINLARYIYQQHYNDCSDDDICVFADGNCENTDISNIVKLSKREFDRLRALKDVKTSREIFDANLETIRTNIVIEDFIKQLEGEE